MKLFGYLPDMLFLPLAGQKRQIYARILLGLYERLFAARVLETPTRDDVLRHIGGVLREIGVSSSEDLKEEGIETDASPTAHYVAYHRLRQTGWLIEEREKWEVLVDMHPDAFMILGAISDFANSRVRVAGAVVEVKSNLESAAREPESLAQGLANAHDTAVRFARSMRRILIGMRDIEDQILGNPDAASILRTFFRDFVDGLLIADYKQLKTSNNPYRYRRQISALTTELLYDTERRTKLAHAYLDQGVVRSGLLADAEARIVGELEKIRQVFEDVGPFMERIDDFRDRLERRVRTTVRYMDIMGEGSAEKIARLIEKLATINQPEIELRLRAPDVGFPITSFALYTPPAPRTAPPKTRFKVPERDPYIKAYIAATSAFDKMVRVTPDRLTAFIETKISDRKSLHSSEIEIESIEDFLAFRSLPAIAGSGAVGMIGDYRIIIEEERTENDWINLRSFRIERSSIHEVS